MSCIDYQSELNREQLDVVLNGDGPCLVLAGAGSGKTRTITYRVARLLESGVDASQILLLTFTNKAAKEMMGRIATIVGEEAQRVWGGTFHSIANRLLRSRAESVGYSSRFTILDQEDAQSLLKAVMKEFGIESNARRFPAVAVVHHLLSFATNTTSSIGEIIELKHPHFEPFLAEITKIGELYHERKIQANAMDFDDLLTNWLRLLADAKSGEDISRQFRHVLVDEYQDTNALQARIVTAIARVHRSLLVVGDDAQSIYAFRGADVKNILSFPREWPDAKRFTLCTNYRSVPNILDLANESLANNEQQFPKELVAARPQGKKPVMVPCASARKEAEFVATRIEALQRNGVAMQEMAILFRSAAHSQALEFELLKRNMTYEYRGGLKFFERAHVKDALAHLRVIENVKDEAAWIRALNLHAGIGLVNAIQIARIVQQMPEIESALASDFGTRLASNARAGWEACASLLSRLVRERSSPSSLLHTLLSAWYRDYLEREYPDWRERQEDLEQLALFAETAPDAASFLAEIALSDSRKHMGDGRRETGDSGGRIVLSTIHQAKGLEWDTVFLIHVSERNLPNHRALREIGGLEEERRLFYVAVTRARNRLFLSYPMTGGFDTHSFDQPSRFLEELSPQVIERVESSPQESDRGWDEPMIRINRGGNPATSVWRSSH